MFIATLDELLFPWTDSADAFITLLPLEEVHLSYLESLKPGVRHASVYANLESWQSAGCLASPYRDLRSNRAAQVLFDSREIRPFAVSPEFKMTVEVEKVGDTWPSRETAKRVNSKVFSVVANNLIESDFDSQVVRDLSNLRGFCDKVQPSLTLVKEAFGVSGRGQYLIKDRESLERLITYIEKQQKCGLEIQLICERFTPLLCEFGAYFNIRADFSHELIGYRKTLNRDSKYLGSSPESVRVRAKADNLRYSQRCDQYLEILTRAGYWGPVCFDSAILKDGRVRCVLEINARLSMGMIAHSLSKYVTHFGCEAELRIDTLMVRGTMTASAFFQGLTLSGLLWKPGRAAGIVPLTMRSLFDSSQAPSPIPYSRRWAYGIVGSTSKLRGQARQQLSCFLRTINITVTE